MNESASMTPAELRWRAGVMAVGHAAKYCETLLFDWLVYGAVAAYCVAVWGAAYGPLATFAVMAPLSALSCWLYIRLYDWSRTDWLGLETVKALRDGGQGNAVASFVGRLARLGDVPAFLALSIYGDPFMVTIYLRKGSQAFSGLAPRDWAVFWASVIFGNAYWTFQWTAIVTLFRNGLNWIFA